MTSVNLDSILPILKENHIGFVAIFGSYARGEETENSDVDLLVRFDRPTGLIKLVGIENELSDRLHKKVDLVTEGALSPYIKPQVMRDLKILYGKR